jgi:hypothetical protein
MAILIGTWQRCTWIQHRSWPGEKSTSGSPRIFVPGLPLKLQVKRAS